MSTKIWFLGENKEFLKALTEFKAGNGTSAAFEIFVSPSSPGKTNPPFKADLVVLAQDWNPELERFLSSHRELPIWVDCHHETPANEDWECSRLDFSPSHFAWLLPLAASYGKDHTSLLSRFLETQSKTPVTVYTTRLSSFEEIGIRTDALVAKAQVKSPFVWHQAISALSILALELGQKAKNTTIPALPLTMQVTELKEEHWLALCQVHLDGRDGLIPASILATFRTHASARKSSSFRYLTQKASLFCITAAAKKIEFAVIFNAGQTARSTHEKLLVRKTLLAKDNTQPTNCKYVPFPELNARAKATAASEGGPTAVLQKMRASLGDDEAGIPDADPLLKEEEAFVTFLSSSTNPDDQEKNAAAETRLDVLKAQLSKITDQVSQRTLAQLIDRYMDLVKRHKYLNLQFVMMEREQKQKKKAKKVA